MNFTRKHIDTFLSRDIKMGKASRSYYFKNVFVDDGINR